MGSRKSGAGWLRWLGVLTWGSLLLGASQCQVTAPGLSIDADDDEFHMDFPGGVIDVSTDRVLVDVPGVDVEVHSSCGCLRACR